MVCSNITIKTIDIYSNTTEKLIFHVSIADISCKLINQAQMTLHKFQNKDLQQRALK